MVGVQRLGSPNELPCPCDREQVSSLLGKLSSLKMDSPFKRGGFRETEASAYYFYATRSASFVRGSLITARLPFIAKGIRLRAEDLDALPAHSDRGQLSREFGQIPDSEAATGELYAQQASVAREGDGHLMLAGLERGNSQ